MLTHDEINILIESVDAWVSRDSINDFMGDMMGSLLLGKDPEAREQMKLEREQKEFARKIELNQKKEQAILLKAKLLMLRQATTSTNKGDVL